MMNLGMNLPPGVLALGGGNGKIADVLAQMQKRPGFDRSSLLGPGLGMMMQGWGGQGNAMQGLMDAALAEMARRKAQRA